MAENQLVIPDQFGVSQGLSLDDCERDIELANQLEELAYYVKGKRLGRIKGSGWYKEYGTWDNYCRDRWGLTQHYANDLIKTASVIENLKSESMPSLLPKTYRQAKPLIALPPEKQVEVWNKAVETAPTGKAQGISVSEEIKISGRHVQETVDRLYPKEPVSFSSELTEPEASSNNGHQAIETEAETSYEPEFNYKRDARKMLDQDVYEPKGTDD